MPVGRWLCRYGRLASAAIASEHKLKILNINVAIEEDWFKIKLRIVPKASQGCMVTNRNHLIIDHANLAVFVQVTLQRPYGDD
jgi:hypothetical protein